MDKADIANRFKFHPAATDEKKQAHQTVRNTCLRLALDLNNQMPEGGEKEMAIKKLEEVMFWANAGIARNA